MLDQQTKQQIQQQFQQIKPQLKQRFPDLQDQDLQKAQSDPDQLVKAVAQQSGQDEKQIEQQLMQLVEAAVPAVTVAELTGHEYGRRRTAVRSAVSVLPICRSRSGAFVTLRKRDDPNEKGARCSSC